MKKVFLGTVKYGNYHKTITQSKLLLVSSHDGSLWIDKEQLRHGPLSVNFQDDNSLKHPNFTHFYSNFLRVISHFYDTNIMVSFVSYLQTLTRSCFFLVVSCYLFLFMRVQCQLSVYDTEFFAAKPKYIARFGLQTCDIKWAIMNAFLTPKYIGNDWDDH